MKLLVLVASLALARATVTTDNNDEHSLLRGAAVSVDVITSSNQQDQHQHRSLQVILDPGGVDCVPHSSGDGTLVCTIRTIQQTQQSVDDVNSLNYNRVLYEAGYVRYFDGKEYMCIPSAAGPGPGPSAVTAAAFGPPPSTGIGVDSPMPDPTLGMGMGSSGTQTQEQGGSSSSCPRSQPQSNGHCSGWIPSGASETSCQYGNIMCNCAGQDNDANKIGWSCESLTLGIDGNVITTPLTNPTPIDTTATVNAEIFSNPVVVEPEPEPEAPIRSEQVGITLASGPNCPASQPENGSGCQFYTQSSKCPYESTNFPSGWLTCGCTKKEGWMCREYTLPAFSF